MLDVVAYVASSHALRTQAPRAFAVGAAERGARVQLLPVGQYEPARLAVVWGMRGATTSDLLVRQHGAGNHVAILDHGYFEDRADLVSVSLDNLHGRGVDYVPEGVSEDRLCRRYGDMPSPLGRGGYGRALILGQWPGDAALEGEDVAQAYRALADKLASQGYRAVLRPHPAYTARIGGRRLFGLEDAGEGTLDEQILASDIVASHSSTALHWAVMLGRLTIAQSRMSLAYGLCPDEDERRRWATRMAWRQWTMAELARGVPWVLLEPLVQ